MDPGFVEAEAEGGVAENLVEVAHGEVVVVDVAEGWARGGEDLEASGLAEDSDAEEVGGVTDDGDVLEVVLAGDGGEAVDLLLGVDRVGLDDDVGEGDAVGQEIVAAYASLGVAGVAVAASAESDDEGSDLLAIEFNDVIEAGVVDGGGVAAVLGCSEDGDGVGGLGLVFLCYGVYLDADPGGPDDGGYEREQEEVAEPVAGRSAAIGVSGLHRNF